MPSRWQDFDFRLNAAIAIFIALTVFLALLPLVVGPRQQMVKAETVREAVRGVTESWRSYSLSRKGVVGSANRLVNASGALRGWVDGVEPVDGGFVLRGWAADTMDMSPAVAVIVFADGQAVAHVVPDVERGDVASHLGAPGALLSGFRTVLPTGVRPETVRVFAVDRQQAMSELSYASGLKMGGR